MATHPPGPDPRRALGEPDMRPLVAPPAGGTPWWLIAGGFALAAILLFAVLDARRRALTAPATKARASDAYDRAATPIAPLFVPPAPVARPSPLPTPTPAPVVPRTVFYPPPGPPRVIYQQPPAPPPAMLPTPPAAPRASGGSVLVYDTTQGDAPDAAGGNGAATAGLRAGAGTLGGERARASVMRNRATTVPQGTLIAAVLETALDSTRHGLARALVQRDVRGFDGTTVLIQRGSRLIGEYRADLQPGQNRASVMWTRLVRPDGVTIALGSPAADTLGRGGIRGKVNSHFLTRFGAAILQSTLDLGVNLASRVGNNNNNLVLGVPFGQTPSLGTNGQVQPTLTVKQGTAIMVFVARDLDFTGVEGRR